MYVTRATHIAVAPSHSGKSVRLTTIKRLPAAS
jgi:hypothetical protein